MPVILGPSWQEEAGECTYGSSYNRIGMLFTNADMRNTGDSFITMAHLDGLTTLFIRIDTMIYICLDLNDCKNWVKQTKIIIIADCVHWSWPLLWNIWVIVASDSQFWWLNKKLILSCTVSPWIGYVLALFLSLWIFSLPFLKFSSWSYFVIISPINRKVLLNSLLCPALLILFSLKNRSKQRWFSGSCCLFLKL